MVSEHAAVGKSSSAARNIVQFQDLCCRRQVGVLCLIKFSGALVWGAADVLQVKYSVMASMQTLGDSSQTLGFVFAAVGVGCFFGPILFNYFTPPRSVVDCLLHSSRHS